MTTIAWPTTRAFAGAEFSLDLDVSELAFRGPMTGNRTVLSHNADRMRAIVSLPPCSRADAALRQSLIWQLRSNGDYVTFGMQQHPTPTGTLRGSPTVGTTVAAGARSVVLAGATAGANMLLGGSFEVDSNADGLANGWTAYSANTTGTVTYALGGGAVHGSYRQRVNATGLGTTSSDRAGFSQTVTSPSVGTAVTFSAYIIADASGTPKATLAIVWLDAGAAVISTESSTVTPSSVSMTRYSVAGTVPALAVSARVFVWVTERTGSAGAAAIEVDAAQFEVGSLSDFAGLPTLVGGDFLGVGGNLLLVGYAGATGNDAGAVTVPLALPLPAAITSSAAVTWLKPTGLWELDAVSVQLDYTLGQMQAGPVLPFRQVVA